jgi:hypothetical protein
MGLDRDQLMPAATYPGTFVKWADVPEVREQIESGLPLDQVYLRYDLILENSLVYLANGIYVRARRAHNEAGYDHRYNGSD